MRRWLVSGLLAWVTLVGIASAQGAPRFEFGPIVRVDHVRVEGGLTGVMPVAGVAVSQRILESVSVEAEVTWATRTLRRHYTGEFVASAPPARRDLSYAPGWGGAAALVWRGAVSPRVDVGFRAGLSGRSYVETSTFTGQQMPADVERARRSRGGLLFGVDAPVRVTPGFRVIPEVRFVFGPRQVGNAHREWGVSVRGVWGL